MAYISMLVHLHQFTVYMVLYGLMNRKDVNCFFDNILGNRGEDFYSCVILIDQVDGLAISRMILFVMLRRRNFLFQVLLKMTGTFLMYILDCMMMLLCLIMSKRYDC